MFVKVLNADENTVTVGYTPGYTGSFVDRGTVVYGTGFNYQPVATQTVFIPFQATYGHSAAFDPYVGSWGFQPMYYRPASWLAPGLVGYGLGLLTGRAIWGPNYSRWGWWGRGPYHRTNINVTHNHIHRRPWNPGNRWPADRPGDRWRDDRWRDRPSTDRPSGDRWRDRDRPSTDRPSGDRWRDRDRDRPSGDRWRDRDRDRPSGDRPSGDRWTDRRPRPDGNNIYNRPWNRGNLADRPTGPRLRERPDRPLERPAALPDRPRERPTATPERPAVRPDRPAERPTAQPDRPAQRPAARPDRPADRPQTQVRPGGGRNNVVADRNGNVYRQDRRGNLQQRQGNQWSDVGGARPDRSGSRPQVSRPQARQPADTGRINRDLQARQRGAARSQNFERRQTAPNVRGGGGDNVSRPRGGGGQRGDGSRR